MTHTDETTLLKRSIAGDRDAFGALVTRYQALVCSITYSAVGDFGRSEELAQETFIKCWKGLPGLKDLESFRGWLCTIAKNVVRDSLRLAKTDLAGRALNLDHAPQITSTQDGPVETAISREQQALVWDSLRNMPDDYRLPLVLFYRQQQSVKQVAHELDLTETAVKQRLSRGRKMLREHVAAIVSETLAKSKPDSKFTVAVIAALPALGAGSAKAAAAGTAIKTAAARGGLPAWLSGTVLGPLIGFAGGAFGTWMSIRNTSSRPERRFMIKASLCIWAEVLCLLIVLAVLAVLMTRNIISRPLFFWAFGILMTAHFVFLLPAILWINRGQKAIRKNQGTSIEGAKQQRPAILSTPNICGSYAGIVFGGLAWLAAAAFKSGDYISLSLIAITAAVIYAAAATICVRFKKRHWAIAAWTTVAVAAANLIAVNLRFHHWRQHIEGTGIPRGNFGLGAVNAVIAIIFALLVALMVVKGRKHKRLSQ